MGTHHWWNEWNDAEKGEAKYNQIKSNQIKSVPMPILSNINPTQIYLWSNPCFRRENPAIIRPNHAGRQIITKTTAAINSIKVK